MNVDFQLSSKSSFSLLRRIFLCRKRSCWCEDDGSPSLRVYLEKKAPLIKMSTRPQQQKLRLKMFLHKKRPRAKNHTFKLEWKEKRLIGGVHSTEVGFLLFTQQPGFDSWHSHKFFQCCWDLSTALVRRRGHRLILHHLLACRLILNKKEKLRKFS